MRKSKDPLVVTDLVRDRIACIRFPFENKYFEKTSADGYAYLGFSRSRLGLDSIGCYEHVLDQFCVLRILNTRTQFGRVLSFLEKTVGAKVF